jgi:antitoxin (DNA-binding transcriptional repressor) of toxin-antitoxin stability system
MAMFWCYLIAMKAVNVAELKNQLSRYLRMVRGGESLLVRDRDEVIARIDPAGGHAGRGEGDAETRLAELEARGVIRRGRGSVTELLARRPKVSVDAVRALLDEREEGR